MGAFFSIQRARVALTSTTASVDHGDRHDQSRCLGEWIMDHGANEFEEPRSTPTMFNTSIYTMA